MFLFSCARSSKDLSISNVFELLLSLNSGLSMKSTIQNLLPEKYYQPFKSESHFPIFDYKEIMKKRIKKICIETSKRKLKIEDEDIPKRFPQLNQNLSKNFPKITF
jgi:hypothetical protein